MDKLTMANSWALKLLEINDGNLDIDYVASAWSYADAMQAEADKREKEESEKKRADIREMLNAPNTFVEREGQHFDDVADVCKTYSSPEWQPDWSQAPDDKITHWTMEKDKRYSWWVGEPKKDSQNHYESIENANCSFYGDAPSFNYQGNWKDSLRKRP